MISSIESSLELVLDPLVAIRSSKAKENETPHLTKLS